MADRASQEKSSSDQLESVLGKLSTDQIRFVVARQEFATDKEAAQEIGIKPDTVYQWKHRGSPIDQAVRLMALDGIVVAKELRRRNLAKAMAVKVAGLDSIKEPTRQSVATEIIEWEMGRATQKQEIKIEDRDIDAAIELELARLAHERKAEASGEATEPGECCVACGVQEP